MRFAKMAAIPALMPIFHTSNITEVSYLDSYSTPLSGGIRPGPYLPDPPWPVPGPGGIGCYAVKDGAYNHDVGIALIALQAKRDEQCRIDDDDDEFHILSFDDTYNATAPKCKTLYVEGSAAMSMCGPTGWGFSCAEAATLFARIYVPCRMYVNESWRLTGQLTTLDGGSLIILPSARL